MQPLTHRLIVLGLAGAAAAFALDLVTFAARQGLTVKVVE